MSLMTLDEAIQHCRDKENCSQCGQEHKQLREWLEELKDLRTRYNIPTPHGRLIDADKAAVAILMMSNHPCGHAIENINDVVDWLKIKDNNIAFPTIIEAED